MAEQSAVTTINYDEVQEEELEVLKAIYMDDFESVEVKSAWNKATDRRFKLRIRAFSDENSFVTLNVILTTTYPKSPPEIEVEGLNAFHERTRKRIQTVIRERSRQLLGEVMIYAIASEIQDALEDAVQARQTGALPSLEDERANAEEAAMALAKETQAVDARRQKEELEEEDRILKQMVEEEVSRRDRKKTLKVATVPPLDHACLNPNYERIAFDQTAEVKGEHDTWSFSSVTIISSTAHGKDEQLYVGKPDTEDQASSPLIAIKRVIIRKSREEIMDLETQLEQVRKLRHTALLSVYAFRVDRIDGHKSQLVLCTEYANRGSLYDMLELGSLRSAKARQFTTELLEGLDHLHRNGVAHNNLTSKTVLLSGSGSPSLRLTDFGYSWLLPTQHDNLTAKWQVPQSNTSNSAARRKDDVWSAGIIVAQMFLGKDTIAEYISPQAMMHRLDLSDAFEDFMRKMFTQDFRKRPSAFELLPCEFLRTDALVMDDRNLAVPRGITSGHGPGSVTSGTHRSRHNSSNIMEATSRYATDFTEIGRLGKGGFGEVVKARNKLDGGVYAVKKIKQSQQLLDKVLSEVMLLNRLNHPYVVRYYSTWVENDFTKPFPDEAVSTTDETADDASTDTDSTADDRVDFGYHSTGGLDFVSSSGYAQIEFGDDDDDDDGDDNDHDENSSDEDDDSPAGMRLNHGGSQPQSEDVFALDGTSSTGGTSFKRAHSVLQRSRSDTRRMPSVLYIQMEYCERQTLRDMVRRSISMDDAWRYIRQITEGLAHIHGHGIIHRDLKPDNVFIDVAGNPKIGDFGLATTSQYQAAGKSLLLSGTSGIDLTRSIGTALYVAPELRSGSSIPYNDKVDMYSLGVMFYEMCEAFGTAMERIRALQSIREKGYELPAPYRPNCERAAQGRLISCLICHKPSDRPSSMELLHSDILPLKIEDETIRQALSGLSDPRSPYHQKMMSALFSHEGANSARVKALAWDAKSHGSVEDAHRLRFRNIAKEVMESIFRRHGAEESRRESIFPRSALYTTANVVQLLDASSNLLQLPYDLVLPHARQLAGQIPSVRKAFTFGSAYRDAFTAGPPRISEEVDFDIANVHSTRQPEFDEAEVIKVTDEMINELPFFTSTSTICFHLGHSNILDAVLEFCRVSGAQQAVVKETISRLGFHQWNWTKVRAELRKFGLPDTTLEDLEQFDFRDVPEKAFTRLRKIFQNTSPRLLSRLEEAIVSIKELMAITTTMSLQRRIYIAPLASVNARFYEGGMLFQCVLERKSNRTVLAAGGRYDKLIRSYRPVDGRSGAHGAVGVAIGLDPIITHMINNARNSSKEGFLKNRSTYKAESVPKRCDVVIITGGSEGARTAGTKILSTFWANGINCELTDDTRPSGDESEYGWIITIRHEASLTVRCRSTGSDADESDIPVAALVSHIQQEMRERDHNKIRPAASHRQSSHQDQERTSNVHVLMAQYRSKKSNKYHIVEAAQNRWTEEIEGWKKAPILAIETRDDVLGLIRETRLGDMETWRRAVQNVSLHERQYLQQVQDILSTWRKKWQDGHGSREACVFNFRTGYCIYYDLGS